MTEPPDVSSLIQLMRLSGTDKVREYLERLAIISSDSEEHPIKRAKAATFLEALQKMFLACKRDSISEAWPTMAENETQNPNSPPHETQP